MLIIPIPLLIFSRTQAAANPLNFTIFLSLKANTQIKIKKKKENTKTNNSKPWSPLCFDQLLLIKRLAME